MPSSRPSLASRVAIAVTTATLAWTLVGPAAAVTYFVDASIGIDDPGRDATLPSQSWRSLTFAITQIDSSITNTIRLGRGVHSATTGEVFPIHLPPRLTVTGRGTDETTILDERARDEPTMIWEVTAPDRLIGNSELTDLTVERRSPTGQRVGRGLYVLALDTSASPRVTNVVMRGHDKGLSLEANSYYGAASNDTRVQDSSFIDNSTGVFGLAYTYGGGVATLNPSFSNSVMSGNQSDGAWFETGANTFLSPGNRSAATCDPVLTHSTLSGNIGSGLVLYSYNYGYPAGAVRPSVRSSLLSDNGDYSVLENWGNTDPSTFDNNMLGGLQLALYLDEGTNPLLTIAEVNSAVRSSTNFLGEPLFVRDLAPNWHLRPDSPGTDSVPNGLVTQDIDGEDRPVDADGDGTATADVGADEAPACAVTAVVDPPTVDALCGPGTMLFFDATASAMTAGYTCTQPLTFQWYADDVPLGTDQTLSVNADQTTTWAVVVSCPDLPQCQDTEKRPVVVHDLPTVSAGGPYSTCVLAGERQAEVRLVGNAVPVEGTLITGWSWRTDPDWPVLGGATATPSVFVDDTGLNQVVRVTATATDSHGCAMSDTVDLLVWRAPAADTGGPYDACQDAASPTGETSIPLSGSAPTPPGSTVVSWAWTTSVGRMENDTTRTPSLVLRNVPITRTATVTLTVRDSRGCVATATGEATLRPAPLSNPGGPYQEQQDPAGTTSFALDGSSSVPATTLDSVTWTTDLGTFQETGTQTASVVRPTLDIVNTGSDQTANPCLAVLDASGCIDERCTTARVRTTPPVPPYGVGSTFRVRKSASAARLQWQNSPADDTHDIATSYAVWESTTAPVGGWAPRSGLETVLPGAGTTQAFAPSLLDPSGPDRLFLKVVPANDAGTSCPDPAAELPDCP